MKIRRSLLLVPANVPKYVDKAREADVDVIILDIQDAVSNRDDAKAEARDAAVKALKERGFRARELCVRVNAAGSPWFVDDVAAVAAGGADTIMLTHTNGASDVFFAERTIQSFAHGRDVELRVEIDTPLALLELDEIAAKSQRVTALSLGATDFSLEMWLPRHGPHRSKNEDALLYARSKIVTIARAKGWNASDTARPTSREPDEVRASMRKLRDFGFDGCLVLAPTNLPFANEVFGISLEELAWAKSLAQKWRALDERDWDKSYRIIDGVGVVKPEYEYACRLIAYQAVINGDPVLGEHFRKFGFISADYLEEQGIKL